MNKLRREISWPLLALYGLGTILGAGIYVLIGKVALFSGYFSPWAFLLAALIAGFSALSYAELSAKFPRSAGEVVYIQHAFSREFLSKLVGVLVLFTGIVSAATLVKGFVGYWNVFFPTANGSIVIVTLLLVMTSIAIKGIKETVWFTAAISLIELFGLFYVLVNCWDLLPSPTMMFEILTPEIRWLDMKGIMLGAFVAFYAFIGFEDMVNIAEEVKEPEKSLPKAIILALVVSVILYLLIAMVSVLILPIETLSNSAAPFAEMLERSSSGSALFISLISLIAVVNGVLVQLVMCSRVIYGMADQGLAPEKLAKIAPKTKTPVIATVCVSVIIGTFSLLFPLLSLAKITSFIVLCVFVMVNLSLIVIHSRSNENIYPRAIPKLGLLFSVLLAISQFIFGNDL